MKSKFNLLALTAITICVSAVQAQDTVIQPTAVTLENQSSSGTSGTIGPYLQYGSPVGSYWYDGSGLASALATGDPVPVTWPTHLAYANTNSSRVRDTSETADGAPPAVQGQATLVFDLGASFTLKGIALWNGNESNGSNTTRGVETMALSYSSDGVNFSSGETLTFTQETAGVDVSAQVQTLTSSVPGVTHVKMVVNNFGPTQTILNFGEIRMISAAPPGLKWASASAGWTAADVWENESAASDTFADGDNVTFEDSKSGIGPITVSLDSTVSPLSTRFENSTKDYTISGTGTISGATGLIKQGTASVTLATANDYTGGTTLNDGQLNIDNASALGTGTFTIAGGTIDNTSGGAISNANANPMDWNNGIVFVGSNDLDLGTGAVTLGAPRGVDVQANKLTVGGAISGDTFSLTKLGAGTLTLTGISTYTGDTTVSDGVLEFAEATGEAISDDSRLTIDGTGTVELTQNETVRSLYVGTIPQPAGTYSSLTSPASTDFKDAHFTGDAVLTVAQVDELSWDTSTTAGFQKADGNWNTTATNWSPEGTALVAWTQGATANFGGTGSTATVTVTEDLSALALNFLSDYALVSDGPARTITMNGGQINLGDGTANSIGSDLTISRTETLTIGQSAGTPSGTLDILAGATIEKNTDIGDLRIEGLNTAVSLSGTLQVSSGLGRINLGTNQTSGTDVNLTIESGGQVVTETDPGGSASNNLIQVGFASSAITDPADVQGTVTVKNGGLLRSGTGGDRTIRLGQFGTGTLNVEGNGLVQSDSIVLGNGGNGTGILNLTGGTIETGSVWVNKPASVASFDGGTLMVTSNTALIIRDGGGAANILDGGLTVNTNSFDASITEDLLGVGTGGLTKTGAGNLTIASAANSYSGNTAVGQGSLIVNGDIASSPTTNVAAGAGLGGDGTVADVSYSAGSTFPWSVSDWTTGPTLDAGTVTIPGALTIVVSESTLANFVNTNTTFTILSASTLNVTNPGLITVNSSGFTIGAGSWAANVNGNTLELVYTAAAASDYNTWLAGFTFAPGADTTPTGNPDGDGLKNQQEYAYGLNPTSGSSVNPIKITLNKGTGQFTYTRRASTGLIYKVLTSTTLSSWTEDALATQTPGAVDGSGNQDVVVELSGLPLTEDKFFVRVSAE